MFKNLVDQISQANIQLKSMNLTQGAKIYSSEPSQPKKPQSAKPASIAKQPETTTIKKHEIKEDIAPISSKDGSHFKLEKVKIKPSKKR